MLDEELKGVYLSRIESCGSFGTHKLVHFSRCRTTPKGPPRYGNPFRVPLGVVRTGATPSNASCVCIHEAIPCAAQRWICSLDVSSNHHV